MTKLWHAAVVIMVENSNLPVCYLPVVILIGWYLFSLVDIYSHCLISILIGWYQRLSLESTRQEDLEEPDCEKSLYVSGGYYRPHEGDTDSARHLCDSLSRICNHTQSHIWQAGDFNYPGIDWTDRTSKSESRHVTRHSEFLDTLDAGHH